MDRRQVIQLSSLGAVTSVAGCLSILLDSDDGSSSSDELSRTWAHTNGAVTNSRHITGNGLSTGSDLERRVIHEFDDSRAIGPEFASAETLCFRIAGDQNTGTDINDTVGFFDPETGDERWRFDRNVESMAQSFDPPDGTTAHGLTVGQVRAIADEIVYVTVNYYAGTVSSPGPLLSTGLFALDAADGAIHWSTTTAVSYLRLDSAGRLYAIGVSDALFRAEPGEQNRTDDEWKPEPDADERIQVQALNAQTGDSSWEWETVHPWDLSTDPPGGNLVGAPFVSDDRLYVPLRHLSATSQTTDAKTELFALETATGDQHESLEFDGTSRGRIVAADDQIVAVSNQPPTDDANMRGNVLFSITPEDGSIDWMTNSEPVSSGLPAAVTDDVLILAGETVVGVDMETSDILWETEEPADVACVVGDTLVTTDGDHTELQLRELESGDTITRTPLDGSIIEGSSMIAADDRLFLGLFDEDGTQIVSFQ